MNPNFRYAQIIPGRDAVRGTGIIESRRFTRIVDSVELLAGCACWSGADDRALRRIDSQIAADGSMPRELARTRSYHYSDFNLQAFAELATLASFVDVDLWGYVSVDSGACIRSAVDFLVPYWAGSATWQYDEITDVKAFQETAQTLKPWLWRPSCSTATARG